MPRKPIIEREVAGANQEARRLLLEAQDQGQRVIEEAERQAEQMRETGYEEGYQEGLGRYTEQVAGALLEVQKLREAIEPEFIGLVRACVERIVGEELRLNPEAIVGIVRIALRDATQQREINVRVNPADAEALRVNNRRLLDVLARATLIEIREDPTIGQGGCVIQTELGTIDASLERQLAALEAILYDELHSGGSAPEAGYEEKEES